MNTHETYVSLETAKLLKQAGFDWGCRGIYVLDSENDPEYVFSTANFTNTSKEIEGYIRLSAPTLDVAQRWLRKVKESFIGINPISIEYDIKWQYVIINYEGLVCAGEKVDAYEESQEAGIRKALEIILEKGE